jgi:hypothetical protein
MEGIMSGSSKKSRKAVTRKTKAQLVQELDEVQISLKDKEKELTSCRKALIRSRSEVKKYKELKKKPQKIKENGAIQIEEDQKTEVIKNNTISSKPRSFLIYFVPRQGHLNGYIQHLSTEKKQPLNGLDSDAICKFISKHLPQVAEKEKSKVSADVNEKLSDAPGKKISRGAKMRVNVRRKTMPPQVIKALKDLKLQQMNRILEPESALQAHRPFALQAQLHFPVMPTESNLDIDTSNYEVLVILTDAKKENVVARRGVADNLSAQVADYENKIHMPGLLPGKYWMKISAFAPYANIEDSKEINLNVQR